MYFTRSYKPVITLNPDGKCRSIVEQMKSLKMSYKPTPWLIGPDVHTIWGMRYRGRSGFKEEEEMFLFKDGGNAKLDWFYKKDVKQDSPIVVIIHTLGGGTREPCTNFMATYVAKSGWRCVVANCRGCSGAKITSPRLYNAYESDDIDAVVEHVRAEKKPSHIFIIGFSLGTVMSLGYASRIGKVDALCCVSHPYRTKECCELLHKSWFKKKVYLSVIMEKLTRVAQKSPYIDDELKKKLVKSKTLEEFDDLYTAKTIGMKDHVEYYNNLKIEGHVPNIKVPVLLINSDDDPFTKKEYFPADLIGESEYFASVRYPEGAHVSFCTGMDGKGSIAEVVAMDWFTTIVSQSK